MNIHPFIWRLAGGRFSSPRAELSLYHTSQLLSSENWKKVTQIWIPQFVTFYLLHFLLYHGIIKTVKGGAKMTEFDRYFLEHINELWALTISNIIILTIYGEDGIINKIFDKQGKEVE